MKTKYDIEVTINNVTSKGIMEIYDDSLKLCIDNKNKSIFFNNIADNFIENNLLKLILQENIIVYINTTQLIDINSFITLQKNADSNCPINFKSDQYYLKKYFRNGFITGFLVVLLYNIRFFDMYVLFGSFIWGLILGVVFMVVGYANSTKKDRATGLCPHCKKELILNDGEMFYSFSINESEIATMTCNNCGNRIGIKHNHLYKLTPQNEFEFNKEARPLIQQELHSNVNTSSNEDDIKKLETLKQMLDKNIITQEDYDKKKQEILNKI